MPTDPVTLALITSITAGFASVIGLAGVALGYWNTQRQWSNQRTLLQQQRAWDIEDRKALHEETKSAISVVGTKADKAYNEANHTKDQIIKLHEENNAMHKDIGAVLEVAKAVRHATGELKPLVKSDIPAVAKEVAQAIKAIEPIVKADIPEVAQEVVQAIRRTGPLTSSGD